MQRKVNGQKGKLFCSSYKVCDPKGMERKRVSPELFEPSKDYKMKNVSKNPMFRYLILLTICSTVGLQTWRTLFNNFSVEIVNLNGYQIGVIQSVREIPGFLALLVIFCILIIKEYGCGSFTND